MGFANARLLVFVAAALMATCYAVQVKADSGQFELGALLYLVVLAAIALIIKPWKRKKDLQ